MFRIYRLIEAAISKFVVISAAGMSMNFNNKSFYTHNFSKSCKQESENKQDILGLFDFNLLRILRLFTV